MSRRLMTLVVLGTLCAVAWFSAVGFARRQEQVKGKRPAVLFDEPGKAEELQRLDLPPDEPVRSPFVHVNGPPFNPKDLEAIRPTPHPIPDNPPPHEGAMIDYPQVIDASDTLSVALFTSPPGRPIGGERLVQADGTIDLGYYGSVNVNGLTLDQAKKKIIVHLRQHMNDEQLGIIQMDDKGEPILDKQGKPLMIAPEKSILVSVSFISYASKVFYVQEEVAKTGRYPYTGNETILDALSYAGGLNYLADRHAMKLVRPARDGKPTKILPIDYDAILNGDVEHNYQIFPGDRIIAPAKAGE